MAEDWRSIAAEVEQALASIGDTSQTNGYPATLRRAGARTGGTDYQPIYGDPTYYQVICMRSYEERKDLNGTLIGTTIEQVLLSGAAGVEPTKADKIILGQHLTFVDDATDEALEWREIVRVEPMKPANVAVMYVLDLGS